LVKHQVKFEFEFSLSYNTEIMPTPDFDRVHSENEKTHRSRLNKLISLGMYDLILLHGSYRQIEGDAANINSEFNGEPTVRLKASRSKQGEGVCYREVVELIYDGVTLSINGAHPIYSGQIPIEKTVRERVIGEAMDDAFRNPKRIIITDFDPRLFY